MPTTEAKKTTIQTASGAEYRVVDPALIGPYQDDTPKDILARIDAAIWQGDAIEIAMDFQGGGEAYRETRRFRGELVESIGIIR